MTAGRGRGVPIRVRVELLALFRQKTGVGEIELQVTPEELAPDRGPSALTALRCLESSLAPRAVGVLVGDHLRKGVLVFVRRPGAPMRRLVEPAGECLQEDDTLVLATAMEGG